MDDFPISGTVRQRHLHQARLRHEHRRLLFSRSGGRIWCSLAERYGIRFTGVMIENYGD
ncbi:MAG: hypothetical protein V9G11_09785 [Bifidobacterium adolescentis]